MERAYSVISIKSFNEEQRVIEGIATTAATDRMGDIVEPMGAKLSLPMPLLWQHDSSQPVGEVIFAQPTPEGIPFRAYIANITEPGTLKDRVDEAWQSVKAKLVRAVSIGFRSLKDEPLKGGGTRFVSWLWLELSLVTIPANVEATIQTIKRFDVSRLTPSPNVAAPDPTVEEMIKAWEWAEILVPDDGICSEKELLQLRRIMADGKSEELAIARQRRQREQADLQTPSRAAPTPGAASESNRIFSFRIPWEKGDVCKPGDIALFSRDAKKCQIWRCLRTSAEAPAPGESWELIHENAR